MESEPALAYYEGGPELTGVVLDALRAAGREVDPLDPDDLAGLDEFHGLGRAATLTMADLAGIAEGARVLEVGAGIGGPARTLARHLGADITALDPTSRFCGLNEELCRRSGLAERVRVVRGDARRIPVGDGEFDVAWTQAVWPNADDKQAMLREEHRVLVERGRLAVYEVVQGPADDDLHYPVPWANGPAESFVVSSDEMRRLAESAGFTVQEWLEGPELVARIGETAGAGRPGMVTGVDGVTLARDARLRGAHGGLGAQRPRAARRSGDGSSFQAVGFVDPTKPTDRAALMCERQRNQRIALRNTAPP